jgi:hypothetical protein
MQRYFVWVRSRIDGVEALRPSQNILHGGRFGVPPPSAEHRASVLTAALGISLSMHHVGNDDAKTKTMCGYCGFREDNEGDLRGNGVRARNGETD